MDILGLQFIWLFATGEAGTPAPPDQPPVVLAGRTLVGAGGYVSPLLEARFAAGDFVTQVVWQLVDQDHQVISLTGKTVELKLLSPSNVVVRNWTPVAITDAAAGKVGFSLLAGESGLLYGYLRVITPPNTVTLHPPAASPHKMRVEVLA